MSHCEKIKKGDLVLSSRIFNSVSSILIPATNIRIGTEVVVLILYCDWESLGVFTKINFE